MTLKEAAKSGLITLIQPDIRANVNGKRFVVMVFKGNTQAQCVYASSGAKDAMNRATKTSDLADVELTSIPDKETGQINWVFGVPNAKLVSAADMFD